MKKAQGLGPQASRAVAGAVLAAAAAGTIAAALVMIVFARKVVTPPTSREQDVRILAVDATTVTLSASIDSLTPGLYSLWFDDDSGHARVGEIISYSPGSVTRHLHGIDYGDLAAATRGRLGGWYYLTPSALGFDWTEVSVQTELGPAPAWLIPAAVPTGRWVIQVHGRGVTRQEGLRAVPVFRDAGYTSLLVSYRNDGVAPPTPDNRYSLGDTEWQDVDAAIQFALLAGATEVILMGWSMGGATVMQAVSRSAHADSVRGVVLDSPVVDWITTLNHHAAAYRMPPFMWHGIRRLLSRRWAGVLTGQAEPIDLNRLDIVQHAAELSQPILLLHSDDDVYVPSTASWRLAQARGDLVTYHRFVTAQHARLWNYDSRKWNEAIADWLSAR